MSQKNGSEEINDEEVGSNVSEEEGEKSLKRGKKMTKWMNHRQAKKT